MESSTRDSAGHVTDNIIPRNDIVKDDDTPILSSQTLEALKEFLADQNRTAIEESSAEVEEDEAALVTEDWRLSQFWYNLETC